MSESSSLVSSLDPAATTTPVPLDLRRLLARCDRLAVALRRLLAHRHDDEAYWTTRGITASAAQRQRALIRAVANLLHVARAAARGRRHGTHFLTLAAQDEWLARRETYSLPAAELLGLSGNATLTTLRAGLVRDYWTGEPVSWS